MHCVTGVVCVYVCDMCVCVSDVCEYIHNVCGVCMYACDMYECEVIYLPEDIFPESLLFPP